MLVLAIVAETAGIGIPNPVHITITKPFLNWYCVYNPRRAT